MTTMSLAWRLAGPGGPLALEHLPAPEPGPGEVRVLMEAVPLLGYLGEYVAGRLPHWPPPGSSTPGTNGVGTVEAVGRGVYHLAPGRRVAVQPHLVAAEQADEPARMLIGLTGIGPDSGPMPADRADGTLAERVIMPAAFVTPLDGLDDIPSDRLAAIGKFAVPLGGLLRGRPTAGETLVANGASGYFGSAAVPLGLALGAERVIAAGRSADALHDLARAAGRRAVPVVLTGDTVADAMAIRAAAGDRGSPLAALRSLRRGGRLVLMGSMTVPLPLAYGDLMINDWEVIGNFMDPPDAFRTLASLVRSGLLDLDLIRVGKYPLADLPEAMRAAAAIGGLDCTVVTCWG